MFLNGCFQAVAFVPSIISGAATGKIAESTLTYALSHGVKNHTGKLTESVIAEESNIPFKSDSLYKKDQMAANNIVNPSKVVRAARTLSIERTCIHLIK